MSGITRNTHLVVGGTDWAYLADEDMREHSVNSTVPSQVAIQAAGVEHVNKLPHSVNSEITVPALYYSTLSNSLGGRRSATVFVIWDTYTDAFGTADAVFEGGDAIVSGVPQTAPSTDAITNSVTFMPARPWARGTVAQTFRLAAGALSVPVSGAFTSDQQAYVVVTTKSSSTSRSLTLRAGSDTSVVAFTSPAIKPLPISGFSAGTLTGATISTTGLTGDQTIEGYVLIGQRYERPS